MPKWETKNSGIGYGNWSGNIVKPMHVATWRSYRVSDHGCGYRMQSSRLSENTDLQRARKIPPWWKVFRFYISQSNNWETWSDMHWSNLKYGLKYGLGQHVLSQSCRDQIFNADENRLKTMERNEHLNQNRRSNPFNLSAFLVISLM